MENGTDKYRALEERMTKFAKNVLNLCRELPRNKINDPLVSQVVRSAGSIGANYKEANDSLGKKDLIFRIRISRKEAKETDYWLDLIAEANLSSVGKIVSLRKEVCELRNILSAIILKLE